MAWVHSGVPALAVFVLKDAKYGRRAWHTLPYSSAGVLALEGVGFALGRLSIRLASSSPTKSSFTGSQVSLRPRRIAMFAR